jgi:prepilin-type N-terminal cleavage/methylation domain-containing protein
VRGFALLEVIVALALLATTGLALIQVVRQAILGQREVERSEATLREADRVLTAYTLLKEPELDQSIGEREIGEFVVATQRAEPGLYRLAIAERRAPDHQLLVTVVHRATPSTESP